jgi:hypothetical protein
LRKLDVLAHLHRAVTTCPEAGLLVGPDMAPLGEGWITAASVRDSL